MENLQEKKTVETDNGLIKALAVAFPEARITGYTKDQSIKFHTPTITNVQFENLSTILELYNKEISLKRSAAQLCIEISNIKEVLND